MRTLSSYVLMREKKKKYFTDSALFSIEQSNKWNQSKGCMPFYFYRIMFGFPSSMVEGATKKQNDAQPDPGEKCLKLNSLHHKQQDALLEPYSVSHYVDDQLVSVLSTAGQAHGVVVYADDILVMRKHYQGLE